MTLVDVASGSLLCAGAFFFLAGTLGLLRFPDVYTRLHTLTKADNVGLGFVVCGLAVEAEAKTIAKLGIIWALVLISSSLSAQLIAKHSFDHGPEPWRPT
ncbi:MAG: monovalent cation/H(+) antiporter subunit G [Labilithrix sp.]|nr:monovalent cation/H(+) antiporter subunit G [Labilithrix sp.]